MGQHLIWLDNYIVQFKNSCMFFLLSRMHIERGVPHISSFFKARTRKGEHDGASECVERALVQE
jgi:hypothetical protein